MQELANWTPPASVNVTDVPLNLYDYVDPFVIAYADNVVFESGVVNPTYALGEPGGFGARIEEDGDFLIVDLTDTLPAGAFYEIRWRRGPEVSTLPTVTLYPSEVFSITGTCFSTAASVEFSSYNAMF